LLDATVLPSDTACIFVMWRMSKRVCPQMAFHKFQAPKHVTLEAAAEKKRTIIVGDVHGCYDELCALLDKVRFHETDDTLIFVGDLVNKARTIRRVLKRCSHAI